MSLSGEKVALRALELTDLDALCAAYQDFDLQLITDGDAPPMSAAAARAFWESIILEPGADLRYFGIEARPGQPGAGGLVGACSLQHIDWRNRSAELAIFMTARTNRGQGFGQEAVRLLTDYAFEVTCLERVYLTAFEFNEAGLRAYERAGFHYEGCLRHTLYYQGRWWDEWAMGLLRAEWGAARAPRLDGLRPYHPADEAEALALFTRLGNNPDDPRAALRRWLRRLDAGVYSLQVEGTLSGMALVVDAKAVERLAPDDQRSALNAALRRLNL